MPKFQFSKTITVDGTPYKAGAVVAAEQIPPGCFESLTRLRILVEVADQPDPAEVFAAAMAAPPVEVPTRAPEQVAATDPAPSGPLVGPPGEVPASAPEQPKVGPKQPDPKRKK